MQIKYALVNFNYKDPIGTIDFNHLKGKEFKINAIFTKKKDAEIALRIYKLLKVFPEKVVIRKIKVILCKEKKQ